MNCDKKKKKLIAPINKTKCTKIKNNAFLVFLSFHFFYDTQMFMADNAQKIKNYRIKMKPTFIKYGRRKIRIEYIILKDCFGLYDPNTKILQIDRRLKGLVLFNTIFHELFHIIMNMEDIDVNTKGEEPIAQAVGDGYEKIFKANSYLFKFLTQCLKKAK